MTINNKKVKLKEKYINKFNTTWNNICGKNGYERLPNILPATRRIIVIGDIHGDFAELINCLVLAGLINSQHNWIGGDTVVVQVGDQIDSCRPNINNDCHRQHLEGDKAEDIKILKFMTNLHNEAIKFNGAIYSLVGNHEIMNSSNDMRYVSYKNVMEFADNNIPNENDRFNDGLKKRNQQFAPGNELANFIACTRMIALVIGSNLFVHAGIVKQIADNYQIEDLNIILGLFLFNELDNPKYFKDIFTDYEISPIWTRIIGFKPKNLSNQECSKLMNPLKKTYNVGRLFVGHTPQIEHGLNSICDGAIQFADNGVSRAFKPFDIESINGGKSNARKAQVIEILDDEIITVLH